MNDKITNWTSADDAMVENAIRRGASRRELLKMLLAGGAAVAARRQVGDDLIRAEAQPCGQELQAMQAGLMRHDRVHFGAVPAQTGKKVVQKGRQLARGLRCQHLNPA